MITLNRRHALGSLAALTLIAKYGPARAAKPFQAPASLVDAAKKEGELILYTAAFPEVMQDTITLFNKRFSGIKVRMVRASGGQLITRVRTEASQNKLEADVLDHSDRAQVKSLEELVAMAKAQPGKLTYGSAGGAGAPTHLAVEMFKQRAGVDLVHIPYQGGAPATNDLLAGHINLMFNNPTQSLPYIKAGQVRGLAVTGLERNPLTPDLPTVAELGYPGFDVGTWFALWGPAGLPPEVVRVMSDAIKKISRQPDVLERLSANGLHSIGGTPDELAKIMKSDHEIWGKVIRDANIKIE